jgi:hypothetical protein
LRAVMVRKTYADLELHDLLLKSDH